MVNKPGFLNATALKHGHQSPLNSVMLAQHRLLQSRVLCETVVNFVRFLNNLSPKSLLYFAVGMCQRDEDQVVCPILANMGLCNSPFAMANNGTRCCASCMGMPGAD